MAKIEYEKRVYEKWAERNRMDYVDYDGGGSQQSSPQNDNNAVSDKDLSVLKTVGEIVLKKSIKIALKSFFNTDADI